MSIRLALAAALALLVCPLHAQFATTVVQFNQGPGGGVFNPTNILGGPTGGGFVGGSLDILSLGAGGSVTLGFGAAIADGPGVDFTVFENGFEFPGGSFRIFSEVVFVEVSTNGIDFARFPTSYVGPPMPPSPFNATAMGTYDGLAGGMPVLANVMTNSIDPLDPVMSGGESFDLAELSQHSLVLAGLVDLTQINFVRLVDIVGGTASDSAGNVIFDDFNGMADDSADIDAVAVINSAATVGTGQPEADLFFDQNGFLHLRLSDPDGVQDLSAPSFRHSYNLFLIQPVDLPSIYFLISVTPTSVELMSRIPFQGLGVRAVFGVSIRDASGGFSADQIELQG